MSSQINENCVFSVIEQRLPDVSIQLSTYYIDRMMRRCASMN